MELSGKVIAICISDKTGSSDTRNDRRVEIIVKPNN